MKITLLLFVIFTAINTYAQQISDYNYVYISENSKDFAGNRFGLNDLLAAKLKSKNYEILTGESNFWPDAAKSNPCSVLQAEVQNISSFLKNKLRVDFKDCNGKIISSQEGKSNIKDYETGYREALGNSLIALQPSNPVNLNPDVSSKNTIISVSAETPKTAVPTPTRAAEKTQRIAQNTPSKSAIGAETYSNGTLSLNRIVISEEQFILGNPNSSKPYAIFRASTKKDIYRVQLQDGAHTFGYLEDGKIVIETTNADGSAGKEVFARK